MKKIVLILGLIFTMLHSSAFAITCDYNNMCAPVPSELASKKSCIMSKITGMNLLSEKIAQAIIKKELKKATKESFKVEMKSFGAKELLNGKFKSLKISGKNLEIDGAYLSKFEAKTVCNFNSVELNKKSIKFKENFVMDFAMEISNLDLKKTIKSTGYLTELNKINLSGFGITFFKLSGADVEIKNNKLFFNIKVTSPLSANPISILVGSDLKVEDGQILLTKLYFTNIFTIVDLSKMTYLLNALNPLTFSTDILNNKDAKTKIKSVEIIGDKIFVKGSIFIPKNAIKKA